MTTYLDTLRSFLNTPLVNLAFAKVTIEMTRGNALQLFTTFLAFSVVLLTIYKKGYAFILNITKKLLGFILYLGEGLYAKIILDLILILKSGYVLYKWGYKPKKQQVYEQDITTLSTNEFVFFLFVALIGWLFFGITLQFFYNTFSWINGRSPFIDAFHTSFAIINYYLLAQKKRESWLFSLAGQVAFAYLFIMGVKPFAIKYIGYIFLSLRGYYQWGIYAKKRASKTSQTA